MIKRVITLLLFVSMALIVPASVSAKVFTVIVSPKKIHQGDVFLVTVRGGSNCRTAFRFVCKQELVFSECGDRRYCAVGAVDITTNPGRQTVRIIAGKREMNVQVLEEGVFSEIRMSLPEEKVSLCTEDRERVERENERYREFSKR